MLEISARSPRSAIVLFGPAELGAGRTLFVSTTMLVSHRGCAIPELGATVMDHSVLHPRFRLVVSVRRHVIVDDGLFRDVFPRRLDADRANLLVAIEGPLEVRRPNEPALCIDEGGFLLERRDRDWGTRIAGRSVMLVIEWADDVFGGTRAEHGGQLRPSDLTALREALSTIANTTTPSALAIAGAECALDILRAAGVPLPPFTTLDFEEPVAPVHAALARAIDVAVSSFVSSPRSSDLEDELGWSSRHVTRRLSELNRRYGFNASGGVRDVLGRWRIYAGTALMTAPDATPKMSPDSWATRLLQRSARRSQSTACHRPATSRACFTPRGELSISRTC